MAAYEHQSLTKVNGIRLLRLRPVSKGTPLLCNLVEVSLDDSPEYEAICTSEARLHLVQKSALKDSVFLLRSIAN
jgi:acetoacetate decarboxylase